MTGLAIEPMVGGAVDDAATLMAREQVEAVSHRRGMPTVFTDAEHCRDVLIDLLASGLAGFVARDTGRLVGLMCGATTDAVGFIPGHGLAVAPGLADPTAVVVALLAEVAPVLVGDGAVRFTIDHVDLHPLGAALHNVGFGRGAVFATQPARPTEPVTDIDVRVGTASDLDAITALSHIEFTHRSTPPIYAPPQARTPADTRALHERLFEEGALHFLARVGGHDVGLVTVEFTSPAPRLCPNGQPCIGPTATHPSMRGRGIGRALVHHVVDWAHTHGHRSVSVDFDSANPLSRPFWLGLGFEPTGYRLRRTIDTGYAGTGHHVQ